MRPHQEPHLCPAGSPILPPSMAVCAWCCLFVSLYSGCRRENYGTSCAVDGGVVWCLQMRYLYLDRPRIYHVRPADYDGCLEPIELFLHHLSKRSAHYSLGQGVRFHSSPENGTRKPRIVRLHQRRSGRPSAITGTQRASSRARRRRPCARAWSGWVGSCP